MTDYEDLSGAQFVIHHRARYRFGAGTRVHRIMREGESWLRVKPPRRDWYLIDTRHLMHRDDTDQEF